MIENYTTYVSIADRAIDLGFDGRVVWGSGNEVGTRLSGLTGRGLVQSTRLMVYTGWH